MDRGQDEFGTESRMEDSILAFRQQFETFADEHRRVVILPPLGLAQPQYTNADPLIAAGRMGSAMLRKFERIILDRIDIQSREISVKAGPRLRHADRNGKTKRRCGLDRTRTHSLRLPGQALKPKHIGKRGKGVGTAVIADLPELGEPRCLGIGIERTLKMLAGLGMTSQAMPG